MTVEHAPPSEAFRHSHLPAAAAPPV